MGKNHLVIIHCANSCLDGVENPVVNHGVHGEGHRVRGEDLLTRDLEHLGPNVDDYDVLQKWKDEDETRTPNCGLDIRMTRDNEASSVHAARTPFLFLCHSTVLVFQIRYYTVDGNLLLYFDINDMIH